MRNAIKQAEIKKVLNKSEVEELFRKSGFERAVTYHNITKLSEML